MTTRVCQDCERTVENRTVCGRCRDRRARGTGDGPLCDAPGCTNLARTLLGTCNEHAGPPAFYLRPEPGPLDTECLVFNGGRFSNGYGSIRIDGRAQRTHRVVWETMFGPIPDGLCVLHACDNPPCCNPGHLRLGTPADNAADMIERGRHVAPAGERHGRSKLTNDDVRAIRARYDVGAISQRTLAAEYGVAHGTISDIVNRKLWAHVE